MNELSRQEMIEVVQSVLAAELAKARDGREVSQSRLKKGFIVITSILGTVELAMVPFEVIELYEKFTSDKDAEQKRSHEKKFTPLVPAPPMPEDAPPLSDEQRALLWGNAAEMLRRASLYRSMTMPKPPSPDA